MEQTTVPKYRRLLLISEYNNHFESFKKQTKPLVPGLPSSDFKPLNVGFLNVMAHLTEFYYRLDESKRIQWLFTNKFARKK